MYDYLIQNVQIIDGSGRPPFPCDLALSGGQIAAMGYITAPAAEVINGRKRYLTPGFIDIHRHADAVLYRPEFGQAELAQGLTTILNGNCGVSSAPVYGPHKAAVLDYLAPITGRIEETYSSIADYRAAAGPLPLNAGMLVGMGTLRACTAGFKDEELTDEEYRALHIALEQALGDGALGVSLGLGYAPECFYTTEQLIRALAPLWRSGRVITAHIRQEGNNAVAAVQEILEVARELETPLEISHLKAIGSLYWRKAVPEMLFNIACAREEGLDVTCDVYPYLAGATQLIHVLPPEFQAGGVEALTAALKDPSSRQEMCYRIKNGRDFENIIRLVGFENICVSSFRLPEHQEWDGLSLENIAKRQGKDPYDALFDLLAEERCGVSMIDFFAHQTDVDDILRASFSVVISDATYPAGRAHPRVYGAFPRLLEYYVKVREVLSLPKAIQKITRQPADRFGLKNKGRIEVGADGDLCIFALDNIHENSTWQQPDQLAEGMDWVFVNGVPVIREGKFTGETPGRML